MSRGHCSNEEREKVFHDLPSFSPPALLSYCWPSAAELGVNLAMLFIYFISSMLFLRNLLFSGALHCSAGLTSIGDMHKVTF